MTAFLIVLGILAALLALLLWLPVGLEINTPKKVYSAYYGPWLKANVLPDPDEVLVVQLKVLFWKHQWSLFELRSKQKTTREKKKPRSSRWDKRTFSPAKIRRLIQSFRVEEFRWELDTGDPVLNAKLYPAFFLSGYRWGATEVNFEGRNSLVLHIVNRPIRMVTAWIHP